jgi:hypothetical protein
MAKKYIHVNQHKIKANKKHGTNEIIVDPDNTRYVTNKPDASRLMEYLSKV